MGINDRVVPCYSCSSMNTYFTNLKDRFMTVHVCKDCGHTEDVGFDLWSDNR